MKKRDKFIVGGIILVALSKMSTIESQQFDLAGLFGLIILGSILGYIGFAIFEKIKKPSASKEEPQDVDTKYQRIKDEIDKRIARAEKLGVRQFMGELFNDLQHYPAWFKNDRGYTPLITDARDLGKEQRDNEEWEKWQITLKGKDYVLAFEKHDPPMPDDDTRYHGTFEIYLENKKILALAMSCSFDEYSSDFTPFSIEAFLEGEWVKDFKELYDASRKAHADGMKRLEQDRLDKTKNNFGIE